MTNGDSTSGAHQHPRSTAQIGGHPIHPMIIPFPIVGFIGAFVADVVFGINGEPGWATASRWLLGLGLAFAVAAAATGLIEYFGSERIRHLSDALKHMLANVAAVVLELLNFVLRIGNDDFISSTGVYISAVVVVLLLYSGWKGGELVYKHGVGVHDRHGG